MERLEAVIIDLVEEVDDSYTATICGSYRRGAVSSGDIDILLTHPDFKAEDGKKVRRYLVLMLISPGLAEID